MRQLEHDECAVAVGVGGQRGLQRLHHVGHVEAAEPEEGVMGGE